MYDHFINAPITYSEITEALESTPLHNSAVGLDGVSFHLLCHLPPSWKLLLHSLFQKCWNSGTIPSVWKSSVIVPILKVGKLKSDLNSYRPIALTYHVGKLLEKK